MNPAFQADYWSWIPDRTPYTFMGERQPLAVRQRLPPALFTTPSFAQFFSETLIADIAYTSVRQFFRETLISDYGPQISQLFRETLLSDGASVAAPNAFPSNLPGLAFDVIKRPVGGNTGIAKAASGREARVQWWTYPEWEWDLVFNYLPDTQANGATVSDLKTLIGFLLNNFGSFLAFPFKDPDDNSVTSQQIGTGDGVTTSFTILKAYGLGTIVGAEPIGYLDIAFTLNVYVNGVLKTLTTDYITNLTLPYSQQVIFVTPPPAGQAVSVDMHYYFQARIKTDANEFEKFVQQMWDTKKISLVSLKGT